MTKNLINGNIELKDVKFIMFGQEVDLDPSKPIAIDASMIGDALEEVRDFLPQKDTFSFETKIVVGKKTMDFYEDFLKWRFWKHYNKTIKNPFDRYKIKYHKTKSRIK